MTAHRHVWSHWYPEPAPTWGSRGPDEQRECYCGATEYRPQRKPTGAENRAQDLEPGKVQRVADDTPRGDCPECGRPVHRFQGTWVHDQMRVGHPVPQYAQVVNP